MHRFLRYFVLFAFTFAKDNEFCEETSVLSTCRLPSNYVDRIDQNYYKKFVDVKGIPVLGSANAKSQAVLEAARLISRMIENVHSSYIDQIVIRRDRVVVLGRNEKINDLPEFKGRGNDRKLMELRGYNSQGIIVCAEENLLCEQNDDYNGYSVCMHEFAHALDASFTKIDPLYKRLVVTAYRKAVLDVDDGNRLWTHTYAASDPAEYFAELSVAWFDASSKNTVPGSFNGIWSRQQLKTYDLFMAELLTRFYGDEHWRHSCGSVCRDPVYEEFTCF